MTDDTTTTRVLYLPSYGGGLTSESKVSADNSVLVELYNMGATQECVAEMFPDLWLTNWGGVKHKDIPKGKWWKINEYDGYESVEIIDSLEDSGFKQS